MNPLEIPGDATVFRSGDRTVFLYLGATEAMALQAEWGLRHEVGDAFPALVAKREKFEARMDGHDFGDRVSILRACLSQWAEQSGEDISTNAKALKILEQGILRGEVYGIGKKYAGLYRFNALWDRFVADMMGTSVDEPEEEAEESKAAPKEQSAGSTPSETSSAPPSDGASPAAKPTGSRRGRSASTSERATRPAATS